MKRRAFLPFLLTPTFLNLQRPVVEDGKSAPPTKITRIDTTYWRDGAALPWKPNWVWVRVHADSGLVGLGETYPRNEAEARSQPPWNSMRISISLPNASRSLRTG